MAQYDQTSRQITIVVTAARTTVDRSTYYELKLAEISIATGTTAITDAMITDTRSNESVCGFVKGLTELVSTSDLFAQFTSAFNTWFYTMKGQLSTDAAGNLQTQIDTLNSNLNNKTGIKNIPSGSDLNSLIADGYYSRKANNVAATVLNSPTNAAFEMEVRTISSAVNPWAYIHQIIRSLDGRSMYIRTMSSDGSGVWSYNPWNQYTAYALLSVTFTAAGWTASSDGTYYTQTATNSRILAGMTLKPPMGRHTGVQADDEAIDDALNIINRGTSTPASGSVTVKVWEKPTTNITVYYECVY